MKCKHCGTEIILAYDGEGLERAWLVPLGWWPAKHCCLSVLRDKEKKR